MAGRSKDKSFCFPFLLLVSNKALFIIRHFFVPFLRRNLVFGLHRIIRLCKLLRKKMRLIFLAHSGSCSQLGRHFAVAYAGPSGGYNDEWCHTALSPEALAVIASCSTHVWRKNRNPHLVHVGFDVIPNHPVPASPVDSTRVGCTKTPCFLWQID